MTSFAVASADVSWLRVPFAKPISDSTHILAVLDIVLLATLGLGGYKMKVGRGVEEDVTRVRTVRCALGDEVPLMIDANQRYDLGSARRLSSGVAELDILWFEEPMPPDRVADYGRLREFSTTPLAMGERAYYPRALADIVQAGGVDVVQPDALRIGGVRGWLEVAAKAAGSEPKDSSSLLSKV